MLKKKKRGNKTENKNDDSPFSDMNELTDDISVYILESYSSENVKQYMFFCSYSVDKTKVAVLQFMVILLCMLLDKLQCTVTRPQCMAPGRPCMEIRHQCMMV